jgi:hypothetical protein
MNWSCSRLCLSGSGRARFSYSIAGLGVTQVARRKDKVPVRPRPANPKSPSVFIIVGVAYVEAGPCSFANLEGSVCAVHCRRGANE